jgi:hypothetical protein
MTAKKAGKAKRTAAVKGEVLKADGSPMQVVDPMQCGAKTRKGTPCGRPMGWGTGHLGVGRCKNHGGASPRAEVSGALVLARREAVVMGCPLDIDPHDALLECIRIAAGEVQYASEQIAKLQVDVAVGPVVTTHERPLKFEKGADSPTETVVETRHEAPALHIWIKTRHDAMDRLVNFSKIAIAAGIAERQVKVAEEQGSMFAAAIRNILTALGVAEHPEAPRIVREQLTLITRRSTRTGRPGRLHPRRPRLPRLVQAARDLLESSATTTAPPSAPATASARPPPPRARAVVPRTHRNSRVITTARPGRRSNSCSGARSAPASPARRRAPGQVPQVDATKLELGDEWFAIGLSTNEPERFQGHHADHLLLVVDEASGVDERSSRRPRASSPPRARGPADRQPDAARRPVPPRVHDERATVARHPHQRLRLAELHRRAGPADVARSLPHAAPGSRRS